MLYLTFFSSSEDSPCVFLVIMCFFLDLNVQNSICMSLPLEGLCWRNGIKLCIKLRRKNMTMLKLLRALIENSFFFFHFDFWTGVKESSETCMKTTVLSSFMLATFILFAILIVSLWMTCTKLRYRNKDSGLYNAYINHKGQIDWINSTGANLLAFHPQANSLSHVTWHSIELSFYFYFN